MLAVDPTIWVGAVGGGDSPFGSQWTEKVLRSGADQIDYLTLHTYPNYHLYGIPKKETDEILALPQTHWKKLAASAENALKAYAEGRNIPVVVNEFDIIPPWGKTDTVNYMNKFVDAFFIADSIGQAAIYGVDMLAHWDLMNGKSDAYGNEFGLMKADGSNDRQPKYWVYPLWSRFGSALLPVTNSTNPATELSVYAGRLENGSFTLLVLNKTASWVDAEIVYSGIAQISGGLVDVLTASSLDALEVAFNGVANPSDDLTDAPSGRLPASETNLFRYSFTPLSITLIRIQGK
jgi:alpha-L-arabinofuranosidase